MDAILSSNQNQLIAAIPLVKSYDERLHLLSQWWGKISLIGKINSQNVSPSILDEMQHTQDKFTALQTRLIQNLLKEHLQKRIADDHNKSQVAIDILIRNLFERTADVGFLATDDDIRAFLLNTARQTSDEQAIVRRLQEYVKKYSVYDEIIILDTDGKVQAHLDAKNPISLSHDPLLSQTLHTSKEYVETFRHSDLQPKQPHSLIYSSAIRSSNDKNAKVLGVLCLCFRFADEMQGIFANLQTQHASSAIMIIDDHGQAIASSKPQEFAVGCVLPMGKSPRLSTFQRQLYLATTTATKGYQGYTGLGWRGQVMTPLQEAFKHNDNHHKSHKQQLEVQQSQLFSDDLKEIHSTSMLVKDDLQLVVLNGIIAAARQNAVEFMPVLTEIRKIGEDIATIFSDSIDNLQATVVSARLDDVSFIAGLAVDLMDRNLYERANDCRWWALTTAFKEQLQKPAATTQEQQNITDILRYINDLYTVYSNLYVYDARGTIIAVSQAEQQHLVGQPVAAQSAALEALKNKDSQKYTVSAFVPCAQYGKRPTYIYNAAITNLQETQVIGGIGIVFDSEPQFAAMLNDALPKDPDGLVSAGCFALYCQCDGLIVSATAHCPQNIGEYFKLDKKLFELEQGEQQSLIMNYQNKRYAVGVAVSKGYREYKTTGDYVNDIVAFVLVPS